MITFELKFTNGSSFNVTDNENNILQIVVDNFFMKQFNKKFKIIAGILSAEKVDFQKTLSENQIKNGSIVLLLISSDDLADFKLMFNSPMLNQNPSNLMMNQMMNDESKYDDAKSKSLKFNDESKYDDAKSKSLKFNGESKYDDAKSKSLKFNDESKYDDTNDESKYDVTKYKFLKYNNESNDDAARDESKYDDTKF